jgi:DNA-binding response OmpR family regulator
MNTGVWIDLKILIVDDEIRIGNLIRIYLERESFQVVVAENGNEGLDRAINDNYDLIILDVLMPGKDGYQVLEELRRTKKTPVIMLSAKCELEDLKRGYDLGANEFIAKPFSPGAVVTKVKELLSQVS